MNLAASTRLYGGGEGSGCHGPNCGRPKGGKVEVISEYGNFRVNPKYSHIVVVRDADEQLKQWAQRTGGRAAEWYKTRLARAGQWGVGRGASRLDLAEKALLEFRSRPDVWKDVYLLEVKTGKRLK